MVAWNNFCKSGWPVAVLGVVLVNALPGCGDQPASPPPMTQQAGTDPGDAELTRSDVAAPEVMTPEKTAPDRQREEDVAATPRGESVADDAGPPDASLQDAPADTEPVATEPAKPQLPSPPSAEQIAGWHLPNSVRLELLGCADGFGDTFVCCLDVSPDGQQLLVGGQRLTLWSLDGSEPECDLLENASKEPELPILCAAFSPDGKWIAAGDSAGMLRTWKVDTREETGTQQAHRGRLSHLAISPDSQWIATTSYDGQVQVWNADGLGGEKAVQIEQQELGNMVFVAEHRLAAVGKDVTIWDLITGNKMETVFEGRFCGPGLAFHAGKSLLAHGDAEPLVNLWNTAASERVATSGKHYGPVHLADFSPDGTRLATFAGDSVLRVWDVDTGRTVQTIDAPGTHITGLRWSSNPVLFFTVSQPGRLRAWGTPDQGEALQVLQPFREPADVAMITGADDPPATMRQLYEMIDLPSFPQLPNSAVERDMPYRVECRVDAAMDEVRTFYHYNLEQAGWKLIDDWIKRGQDCTEFEKNGFRVSLSVTHPEPTKATLTFLGNVDARRLPRYADATVVTEAFNSTSYRTSAGIVDLETFLLKEFHAAGWTPYTRLNSSSREVPDDRHLNFIQNGIGARVWISRPYDEPKRFVVQCSVAPRRQTIPIPPDAGWIEFDDTTALDLVLSTSMSLEQAVAYYDAQMSRFGWVARDAGRAVKEDRAWLPFVLGQQDLVVGLLSRENQTFVLVGDVPEHATWQLAKMETVDDDLAKVGVEAADFPLPEDVKAVNYDRDRKSLSFEVEMSMTSALEEYGAKLAALGWKPNTSKVLSEEYSLQGFENGEYEISLRARKAPSGGLSVSFEGDGLLWSKPLSSDRQVVSYETWLHRNRHPGTLELLGEYVAAMQKLTGEN